MPNPVSLIDLLDAIETSETVQIATQRGPQPIECRSLTAREIAVVMFKYPAIRGFFQTGDFMADNLVDAAPAACAEIIAVGTGNEPSIDQVTAAAKLPPGTQILLLTTILRLSAPEGLVPLLGAFTRLMGTAAEETVMPSLNGSAESGKGPDTTSPSPLNG